MSDGGLQEIIWSESSGVACYFAIVGKLPEKFCLGGGGGGVGGASETTGENILKSP